jgi:F-type H+-transporting ATPase subunit delta
MFIDLFQGEIQKKTAHFLRVLGSAKRLSLLPEILNEYKKLLAKKNKQSDVLITSAFKLNQSQEEEITGRLKKRYGENLTTKVEIDKTLIGGITIKSGDEVIDLSTKGKLLKLKKQIS